MHGLNILVKYLVFNTLPSFLFQQLRLVRYLMDTISNGSCLNSSCNTGSSNNHACAASSTHSQTAAGSNGNGSGTKKKNKKQKGRKWQGQGTSSRLTTSGTNCTTTQDNSVSVAKAMNGGLNPGHVYSDRLAEDDDCVTQEQRKEQPCAMELQGVTGKDTEHDSTAITLVNDSRAT